ncbi:MAG: DUF1844 domain-containing protein [Phycisphaerae bacterium]|nr:DUF1844 domain-containing protein [Phycisphaerae bacterium]
MTDKPADEEKPKIVVDDDWKAQAQAEKERLGKEADAAKSAAPAQPGAPAAEAAAGRGRELPQADFSTLVSTLVTQIFLALGGLEDPKTKKRYVDLALARHHIDTLSVLEEKTRGNLTEDEKKLLDKALYETRMHYVQLAQRL